MCLSEWREMTREMIGEEGEKGKRRNCERVRDFGVLDLGNSGEKLKWLFKTHRTDPGIDPNLPKMQLFGPG